MSIPKRTVRNMQEIRTISGNLNSVAEPYRAYMRISCLEMEKCRRSVERESAMHRVRNIDARSKEIEAEKKSLLMNLGFGHSSLEKHAAEVLNLETPATTSKDMAGFKISY